VLCIGGDAGYRVMLSRIAQRLESVRLVVTDSTREGRLLAVALSPSLILFDAQLPAGDAHDLLIYLGRASLTATMPLAVLRGSEDEHMDSLLATTDPVNGTSFPLMRS
jgi:DNA-binding response OmpR family regulator